jgi:hypothetical protein
LVILCEIAFHFHIIHGSYFHYFHFFVLEQNTVILSFKTGWHTLMLIPVQKNTWKITKPEKMKWMIFMHWLSACFDRQPLLTTTFLLSTQEFFCQYHVWKRWQRIVESLFKIKDKNWFFLSLIHLLLYINICQKSFFNFVKNVNYLNEFNLVFNMYFTQTVLLHTVLFARQVCMCIQCVQKHSFLVSFWLDSIIPNAIENPSFLWFYLERTIAILYHITDSNGGMYSWKGIKISIFWCFISQLHFG